MQFIMIKYLITCVWCHNRVATEKKTSAKMSESKALYSPHKSQLFLFEYGYFLIGALFVCNLKFNVSHNTLQFCLNCYVNWKVVRLSHETVAQRLSTSHRNYVDLIYTYILWDLSRWLLTVDNWADPLW